MIIGLHISNDSKISTLVNSVLLYCTFTTISSSHRLFEILSSLLIMSGCCAFERDLLLLYSTCTPSYFQIFLPFGIRILYILHCLLYFSCIKWFFGCPVVCWSWNLLNCFPGGMGTWGLKRVGSGGPTQTNNWSKH